MNDVMNLLTIFSRSVAKMELIWSKSFRQMVLNIISSRGLKSTQQPFEKVGYWPVMAKLFWKFTGNSWYEQTEGKFTGREIRRYAIKKILDEGGPDMEMKLRNLGKGVL